MPCLVTIIRRGRGVSPSPFPDTDLGVHGTGLGMVAMVPSVGH